MPNYSCGDCGMEVHAITCGKCGTELTHVNIEKDDGTTVGVAECSNGCGKIKSPMCCGHELAAAHGRFDLPTSVTALCDAHSRTIVLLDINVCQFRSTFSTCDGVHFHSTITTAVIWHAYSPLVLFTDNKISSVP
jgi:hypothetical protein